ncbi:15286_t:CDS:2 [Dentiscutata erythropus]|uniref:15286_t:CDS:1 n=1 Tax=Dentiscutata erythropus TaxID=1348616 RepID=A0A9N9FUP9_9GLOM|nr:15286_t:CDS:2 [Dentiscutata erythropus]
MNSESLLNPKKREAPEPVGRPLKRLNQNDYISNNFKSDEDEKIDMLIKDIKRDPYFSDDNLEFIKFEHLKDVEYRLEGGFSNLASDLTLSGSS